MLATILFSSFCLCNKLATKRLSSILSWFEHDLVKLRSIQLQDVGKQGNEKRWNIQKRCKRKRKKLPTEELHVLHSSPNVIRVVKSLMQIGKACCMHKMGGRHTYFQSLTRWKGTTSNVQELLKARENLGSFHRPQYYFVSFYTLLEYLQLTLNKLVHLLRGIIYDGSPLDMSPHTATQWVKLPE